MNKFDICISKPSGSRCKLTKIARITTGTRWSATVERRWIIDYCSWVVCSGGLNICGGSAFLFQNAVNDAIKCLEDKIYNPKWRIDNKGHNA